MIDHALHNPEVARYELEELAVREARVSIEAFVQQFSPNYHMGWVHRRICRKYQRFVQRVERKQSPRMMVFLPPQRGKSQIVSRAAPAWVLGRHPEWHFIHGSYGQALANDFGRDVRGIITRQRYQEIFPRTRIGTYGSEEGGAERVAQITLSKGGSYKAVGVGVATAGSPATIFSIDDPVKDQKSAESEIKPEDLIKWFSTVASTRLAPGGGIILTMTRWGLNDLAGQLLQVMKEDVDGKTFPWEVIIHPAIATMDEYDDDTGEFLRKQGEVLHPERHSLAEVLSVRASMLALKQSREWSSIYQQNPVPEDGTYYLRSDFRTYTSMPKDLNNYITTDLALGKKNSNDWTVFLPFGVDPNDDMYMHHGIIRKRMDPLESTCRLLLLANEINAQIITLPDDNQGKSMLPFINKMMNGEKLVRIGENEVVTIPRRWYTIQMMPVAGQDKRARGRSFQARQRQGKVFWCDDPQFHEIIQPELLAFVGENETNDIHDACSDAGRLLDDIDPATVRKVPKKPLADIARWKERSAWQSGNKPKEGIAPLFGE